MQHIKSKRFKETPQAHKTIHFVILEEGTQLIQQMNSKLKSHHHLSTVLHKNTANIFSSNDATPIIMAALQQCAQSGFLMASFIEDTFSGRSLSFSFLNYEFLCRLNVYVTTKSYQSVNNHSIKQNQKDLPQISVERKDYIFANHSRRMLVNHGKVAQKRRSKEEEVERKLEKRIEYEREFQKSVYIQGLHR